MVLLDYDALPIAENHQLGLEYLAAGEFFPAHEAWESAWRQSKGTPDEEFFKGLSQLGAGYTHYQRGNPVGAVTLLTRGAGRIEGFGLEYRGVDIVRLAGIARAAIAVLESRPDGNVVPEIPLP